MEDRTASIRRARLLNGLTDFFIPQKSSYAGALNRQKLDEFSGIYTLWSYAENDRWEPYYYQTNTHCRIEAHKKLPILSMQEFDFDPDSERPVIRNRKVGFIVFDDQSCVVRFVVNYRNPQVRWIEVLRPVWLPNHPIFNASDKAFSVNVHGVNEHSQSGADECRATLRVLPRSGIDNVLFRPSVTRIYEKAEEIFPSIQWDTLI